MRDSNPRPPQCQCDALPTALTAHYLKNPFGRCATTSRKNIHRMFFLRQSANRPLFEESLREMRYQPLEKTNVFSLAVCEYPRFCYRGDMPKFLSDNKKDAFCVHYLRNSSGGTRTYNPSVNSRMLCH